MEKTKSPLYPQHRITTKRQLKTSNEKRISLKVPSECQKLMYPPWANKSPWCHDLDKFKSASVNSLHDYGFVLGKFDKKT